MVAELAAAAAAFLTIGAEAIHARRVRRLAPLAFGPTGKPATWASAAPVLRAVAATALVWGFATLALLPPKTFRTGLPPKKERKHLLLLLDCSPSMQLEDAGMTGEQGRRARGADLLRSLFDRTNAEQYLISVVAFYTEAKPVVVDTEDIEVIYNILDDLPLQFAFEAGETDLFAGLAEAAEVARHWNPRTASLVMISDGDTVPSTGMPKMPAGVGDVLIVGVGDSDAGSFINGRNSRQDVPTLNQVAVRLGGTYHNGNTKQIPTEVLRGMVLGVEPTVFERLTVREYALAAVVLGGALLAVLPALLHAYGTDYRPGVPVLRKGLIRSGQISPVRKAELAYTASDA